MKILAVDPSINFAGYAIYNGTKLNSYGLLNPKMDKTFNEEYIDKSFSIFSQLKKLYKKEKIDKVILEIPEHFGVSGYMARESGSIFKLTFLCGMICSLKEVITTPPRGWKGQLPKHVMRNRFIKKFPQLDIENINHNVLDAIAIGLWHVTKEKS